MCDHAEGYESGGIRTVGGVTGNYLVRSPFNTECEFAVLYAGGQGPANAAVAGTIATVFTTTTIASVALAARAAYSSGLLTAYLFSNMSLDITVTALTGGAAPTVTFLVSRKGVDGILYPVKPAPAAISAPGIISQTFGDGDGTALNTQIQIDMITTGAPTSITFSLSAVGQYANYPVAPVLAVLEGQIAVSSNDPSVFNIPLSPSMGSASNGDENNSFDGLIIPLSNALNYEPNIIWQPLGRGANIYVGVVAPTGGVAYCQIVFRRSTSHVVPNKPRAKPNTHTLPPGRRDARKMAHGFAAQYPEESGVYQHMALPEQDTAVMRHGSGAPLQPTNVRHRGTHNGR